MASGLSNQPLLCIQTDESAVRAPLECGRAIHLESTYFVHFPQRLNAGHEFQGVMTRVVSTNVAFEGTLLNQDTRSMVERTKVGITRPAVDGALVLEYDDMLTGKSSKLSRSQCLCLGRSKIRKVRRSRNIWVPQIHSISGLEREHVMLTGGPSISLLRTSTSGHAVVELTSSRIDPPPRPVGNQNSQKNDDDTDIVDSRAEGISVNDPEAAGSRVCLESTEVLMHILAIGESALQSEWNRFCSHKARSRVDNDCLEDLVAAADVAWMGSLEVVIDRREVLEERDVEVMPIDIRIRRQEPVVDRVPVERSLAGESLDWSSSCSSTKISLRNRTSRRQCRPSSYPLSRADMRYFEVDRCRIKSAASSKGKRLMYSSLVE